MKNHTVNFLFLFICILNYTLPAESDITKKHVIEKIVYPDGSKYTGGTKNGKKHGRGRFVWADGAEYRGGFTDGNPHGVGFYWYSDGRCKRLTYDCGRLLASKILSNAERMGDCMFGEYLSNGHYMGWHKGDRIKGFVPHGRGVMHYENGSVYTGQWKEGRMHGNGTIRWDDGSSYTGQWIKGKRSGNGTYVWADGSKFIGQWSDNQMCGNGTFYQSDGKMVAGKWTELTVKVHE